MLSGKKAVTKRHAFDLVLLFPRARITNRLRRQSSEFGLSVWIKLRALEIERYVDASFG